MSESRPKRWADAHRRALSHICDAKAAISDLEDLRAEYEYWKDGLPENLENSSIAEKLQAIIDLDFTEAESALSSAEEIIFEAENADLPLGFGRD